MFKLLILTVALPAIFALDVYEKCKNNGGGEFPHYVNIKDCPTAPCHITEGDFMEAEAGLKVRKYYFTNVLHNEKSSKSFHWSILAYATQNLTVALHAYKFGIRIEFDLPPEVLKACNYIEGASCPLKGGEEIVYNFEVEVEGIPSDNIKVQIEFALLDDKGKNMNCVRFDAVVHNPKRIATHKYSEVPRFKITV